MYYVGNKLGKHDPDPCGQMVWLVEVFEQARRSKSKV